MVLTLGNQFDLRGEKERQAHRTLWNSRKCGRRVEGGSVSGQSGFPSCCLYLKALTDEVGGLERFCFVLEKPVPCLRFDDRYCWTEVNLNFPVPSRARGEKCCIPSWKIRLKHPEPRHRVHSFLPLLEDSCYSERQFTVLTAKIKSLKDKQPLWIFEGLRFQQKDFNYSHFPWVSTKR